MGTSASRSRRLSVKLIAAACLSFLATSSANAGLACASLAHRTSNLAHPPPAYRPFLEPAPIDRYWLWLLPPLVLAVSIVYRTIKSHDLSEVPRRAAYLSFQVAVFMVAAAVLLWITLRLF
ncbi:MAG: hypothetical protein ACIAXF_10255 [Phycisphaerales bacterium JB063]